MARGDFRGLANEGRPLPPVEDAHAGEMAAAFSILRNAGAAPPWIDTDKEVRRLLGERDRARRSAWRQGREPSAFHENRYRELLEGLNEQIERLNLQAPTPRQHRRRLDVAHELAEYRQIHTWPDPDRRP